MIKAFVLEHWHSYDSTPLLGTVIFDYCLQAIPFKQI
jgi:hypothetical protein